MQEGEPSLTTSQQDVLPPQSEQHERVPAAPQTSERTRVPLVQRRFAIRMQEEDGLWTASQERETVQPPAASSPSQASRAVLAPTQPARHADDLPAQMRVPLAQKRFEIRVHPKLDSTEDSQPQEIPPAAAPVQEHAPERQPSRVLLAQKRFDIRMSDAARLSEVVEVPPPEATSAAEIRGEGVPRCVPEASFAQKRHAARFHDMDVLGDLAFAF